jgi:hypothetical protein
MAMVFCSLEGVRGGPSHDQVVDGVAQCHSVGPHGGDHAGGDHNEWYPRGLPKPPRGFLATAGVATQAA